MDVSRAVILVPGGLAEKSTKTGRMCTVALDEVGVTSRNILNSQADVDATAGLSAPAGAGR